MPFSALVHAVRGDVLLAKSDSTYQRPVQVLKPRYAIECIVCDRNSRSPNHKDNAQVIKLVAEAMHIARMIGEDVKACGPSALTSAAVMEIQRCTSLTAQSSSLHRCSRCTQQPHLSTVPLQTEVGHRNRNGRRKLGIAVPLGDETKYFLHNFRLMLDRLHIFRWLYLSRYEDPRLSVRISEWSMKASWLSTYQSESIHFWVAQRLTCNL